MNFERDRSLTVFSSEGKLKQCDHALQAAMNGALSVGISSDDGVVLASLKNFSQLFDKEKIYKVENICETIGVTYSGLQSDFRIVFEKACSIAEDHKTIYGTYPYVDYFIGYFSQIIQEYTQKGGLRPFGVTLFICGPILINNIIQAALYQLEPSGSFVMVKSGAMGKEYKSAAKYIENRMGMLDDNFLSAICSLRDNAGTLLTYEDIDMGYYSLKKNKFIVYKRSQIIELLSSINMN